MEKYELLEATAQRIEVKRKDKGFRQEDVAKFLGLSRTAFINIEAGRQNISLSHLYRLCQLFECQFGDLLPTVDKAALPQSLQDELNKLPAEKRELATKMMKGLLL